MTLINTDTISYPNMILETYANDDNSIHHYKLIAAEGYVLHQHSTCELGNEDLGIPAHCYYSRYALLPPSTDLSTILEDNEAVLESTVDQNDIYGNTDKPEIM